MPIPDFQSVMRPILAAVADNTPLALSELRERIANEFISTRRNAANACLPASKRCQ